MRRAPSDHTARCSRLALCWLLRHRRGKVGPDDHGLLARIAGEILCRLGHQGTEHDYLLVLLDAQRMGLKTITGLAMPSMRMAVPQSPFLVATSRDRAGQNDASLRRFVVEAVSSPRRRSPTPLAGWTQLSRSRFAMPASANRRHPWRRSLLPPACTNRRTTWRRPSRRHLRPSTKQRDPRPQRTGLAADRTARRRLHFGLNFRLHLRLNFWPHIGLCVGFNFRLDFGFNFRHHRRL